MVVDARRIFTEPVTLVSWGERDPLLRRLARLVRTRESWDRGVRRSNKGGWHSTPDLLPSPSPVLAELRRRIDAAVSVAGRRFGIRRRKPWTISAWANVSRRGHSNKLHFHGEATWSGIYYVKVGMRSRPPRDPGDLVLYDLRQLVKWGGRGKLPADTRTHRIRPVPGLLVLFPGTLWHRTEAFSGPGERVSIAFNLS